MTATVAFEVFQASVEEAKSNATFVDIAYRYTINSNSIIKSSDPAVSAAARQELTELLRLRRSSPDPAYRGLVVQIVGAFETFVVGWCAAQFAKLESDLNDNGSPLEQKLRQGFLAKAGIALQYLPKGTVMGARFNFADLESSLPSVLGDTRPIKFHPDVVSVRLGVCNSEKLESLHEFFMLDRLFTKELGSHKATIAWRSGSASPTAAAQVMKKELDELMDLRNDLAHGKGRGVTVDVVHNAAKLTLAIAHAMAK